MLTEISARLRRKAAELVLSVEFYRTPITAAFTAIGVCAGERRTVWFHGHAQRKKDMRRILTFATHPYWRMVDEPRALPIGLIASERDWLWANTCRVIGRVDQSRL